MEVAAESSIILDEWREFSHRDYSLAIYSAHQKLVDAPEGANNFFPIGASKKNFWPVYESN